MADQISNIVDPKVYEDLQNVVNGIVSVESEIDKANGKTISIQVELKGAQNLTEITAAINKQNDALAEQTAIIQKNSDATGQLNQATQQYGQATGEIIIKTANASKEVRALTSQLQATTNAQKIFAEGSAGYIAASQRMATLTAQIDKLSPSLKIAGSSAKEAGNSFSILGLSGESVTNMFARQILRMTAYALILAPVIEGISTLVKRFEELSPAEQAANERLKEYTDQLKELNKARLEYGGNTDKAQALEYDKTESLLRIITNQKATSDARNDSYKELQGIIGGVLANYTKEEVLSGKVTDAINKQLIERANLKSAITENIKEYQAEYDILTKLEIKIAGTRNPSAQETIQQQIDRIRTSLAGLRGIIQTQRGNLANIEDGPEKAKPDNTAKKEMEAELKVAEENRKKSQDIALKAYAESKQTEQDKINLLTSTVNAEARGKQQEFEILDKFAGKIGETQEQELARRTQYQEKYTSLEAKSAETRAKINKEIQDEYAKADGYNKAYVQELEATSKRMAQLESDIADKKALYAAYAKTTGIDLFGNLSDKRDEQNVNFGLSQGESKVRKDNIDVSAAQGNLDTANANVSKAEQTPFNQRNFEEYNNLLNKKNEAQKNFDAISVQTTEDTNSQTDALAKAKQDKEDEDNEKRKAGLQDIAQLSVQLAQETFSAINTIRDNAFAKEQQQLEIQQRELQIQTEQKINAINATTGFEVTKTNQLAQLNAETVAQQNAIQQEQNELALKKAKADKQAAESQILLSTAIAIAKTLPMLSNPVTAAIGAAEIALITSLGAIQYAAAASTPLPQFAEGGITSTPTIIAGERGRELITTPSGQHMMADKAGIYNVPIGSKITPNHITEVLIQNAASTLGISGYDIQVNDKILNELSRTRKTFEDGIENLIEIQRYNMPMVHNNITISPVNNNRWKRK